MSEFTVSVAHDLEAGVWYVEASDIPGLNAEADTYEGLVEVVLDLAPDLIEHNLDGDRTSPLTFPVAVVQHAMAVRAHA